MSEAKVAFVTGAASGFGKAISSKLVEKGWKVALLDINEEAGHELETSLGASTKFFSTDVSSYASQSASFLSAYNHFGGRLDALVANAGIVDRSSLYLVNHRPSAVSDVPPEPDTTATDVDFKGVIYGTYLAVHFMRFNKSSTGYTPKIIATSSCAGVAPHPALPQYSGAKAGVVGFVRAVAPVLKAKEGIAMSAVCPGLSPTAVLPGVVIDAVGADLLTPVEEVVKVFERYLDEEGDAYSGHVGLVMETEEQVENVGGYKFESEKGKGVYEAAMEPIFEALHGSGSGLDVKGMF
ncbi:NAD(P)-binding protein [Rhypophila decipiens]|uniref:NAD(P)-binding protein n=1 Tax=Rhypophila decipiens TaxID=261697 RepID=A0AAN7B1N8_9PEZI|nr:NAD(P)-binding protein [Rhypophila decipiens]